MYERILLPTDGERGVEQAAEHAIELAESAEATLNVLYVVDENVYSAYSGDEFVQDHEGPQATLEDQGQEALSDIETAAEDAGIDVETTMRYGTPAEEIVAEADEFDADFLVLGTRTRPGEYRQFVGHVTDSVLRLTDRPVSVVKTPVEE